MNKPNHIWAWCPECRRARGHRLSCAVGRGYYQPGRKLPRRNPGLSIRRPDRAYKQRGWV